MFKKDFLYAGFIGLITAFFATPILYYSADQSWTFTAGPISFPIWWLFIALPVLEYLGYMIAAKLFSHISALRQLGRFGIVGLMNFCTDTGIATFLTTWFGVDPESRDVIPFLVVGTTVAILNSYFWQRSWTFGEKKPPSRREFIGFVVVTLVGLVINTTVTFLAIHAVASIGLSNNAEILTVAKVAATAISLFWNFLGYKFFVFGK